MHQQLKSLLEWERESGVDTLISDTPGLCSHEPEVKDVQEVKPLPKKGPKPAVQDALALLESVKTLDELQDALRSFEGLAIKKTATNCVFSDGFEKSHVMIIGDAPGGDEDRHGIPFAGVSGQLLDKMFAAIGLSRKNQEPETSLYISNILNWRPPGNRTPTPEEMEVARPFIEKHIALIKPKILILTGAVSLKALIGTQDGITKVHGKMFDFEPMYPQLFEDENVKIPAMPIFHPDFLLRTPFHKKSAWRDLLLLSDFLNK